jgi:RHS repeat-associated protein
MQRGVMSAWLSRWLVAALVVTSLLISPPEPAAAAAGDPFRFIYDQAGRLVASVTPTDTAIHTYDAVGNITAITRQAATVLTVIEFAPHAGAVGASVTIYGTAFSPTPSLNTVKFNGTTATVISSTTTEIVTTVPAGATTGTISVKVGTTTKTTTATFSVANLAPTITGFTPGNGTNPTPVTITGTNFDPVALNNNVRVNSTFAKVTAASATSLTFQVPPAVASGPITVATVNGKATSNNFIVPPAPYVFADIAQTVQINPGSSAAATIGTAGKIALVLIAGAKGQRISISTTPTQGGWVDYTILSPDGSTLYAVTTSNGGIFTDVITLQQTGTQILLIDPQATLTGSWTVNVYDLPADFSAAIAPTAAGVSVPVAITTPGQNGQITFSGTIGQRISVLAPQGPWTTLISIRNPDGLSDAFPPTVANQIVWTEVVPLTQNGTYTIKIDVVGALIGDRTFTVYDVPADFSAPITPTPSGGTVSVNVPTPGQNAHLTFSGQSGGRISLWSTYASWSINIAIRNPDGSYAYPLNGTFNGNFWLEPVSLTQTGTYTIDLDPQGQWTGPRDFTVYDVPPDFSAAITPTPSGASVTASVVTPGQNAHLSFAGSNGQRISLNSIYASWSINIAIRNPDGSYAYPLNGTFNGNFFLEPVSLTQTGNYSIDIDPQGQLFGDRIFTVYDVPDDFSGAITLGGPAVTVPITTPGQNATLTFAASTNQKVTVSSLWTGWNQVFDIKNPDLTTFAFGPVLANGNMTTPIVTLTQNGTYTMHIDPVGAGFADRDFTLLDQGFAGLPVEGSTAAAIESSPVVSTRANPAAPRAASSVDVSGHGVVGADPNEPDDRWTPDPAEGKAWRTNGLDPQIRHELPLVAGPGVTALSGQILALNGRALEGVQVALGEIVTTTDRNGQFLLEPATAGHGELVVNGSRGTAHPQKNYGLFEIGVDVADGRTSVLPYTIWLPVIDDDSAVTFASPTTGETIITTPSIPGLELHLPAGSVVKDMDRNPITSISLTAIPLDRTPFPLPKFEEIPIYFTIQPGGAYVLPKRAQLWYPNYSQLPAGTRVNFWSYDPEGEGWHIYGHGTVTDDATQVRPDADTFLYEFTGAMFSTPFTPPAWWAPVGDFFTGGDPVDLSSGLFVMDHTDLALPDVTPVSLTRTYRQNDANNRGWGPGWSHPYFVYLWSAAQYQEVDLILPDGGRVHYIRTSPGNGFIDAVFEHTATPSAFYKSRITYNGTGWDLRMKDGTKLVFLDNGPLTAVVDRYGNRASLLRTAAEPHGNIQVIRSDNGRWIKFTYDSNASLKRITSVEDNTGRTVSYQYTAADLTGRLWKVTDAAGGLTEYGYDASDRLATIKDARGITYLTNRYDANGRVDLQTQADATTFQFAYTLVNGKVTQTDVTDPRGFVRRVTFNASGYGVTDTVAFGQPLAQTVTYEREPGTSLILSVTDPLSRVTRNTYTTAGNLWTTTSLYGTPDAVTTTFTYEPVYSQLATVTDPLLHTTTFGYDAAVNRVSETDALQHATTFTYTVSGQLATATSALQKTTTFAYEAGDLVSITDPLGRVTRRFSDALGRPLAVTDALGNRTRTDYDALNRVSKVTDPKGGVTQFTYDPNGNRLTVKDAKNNTTTYTYNNNDQLATRKDALLRTETYAYDANGNLLTVTDRKSQVTEFRYDALDRQTFAGFGRTGTPPNYSFQSTIGYTYDAGNRLRTAVDSASGTITRDYDNLDRLFSETTGQGVVTYQFDLAGRRTQQQVAGQTAVTYGYDNADRLQTITQGASVVGFGYDDADRRTSLTLPGSLEVLYGYDDASQLLSLTYKRSGATTGDLAYTYDASGRRATTSGSYARLNLPAAQSTTTYNANNQLTKWGNKTLSYDLNGNMLGDLNNAFSWNARDQLSAVTKTGQTLPSFTYDAFGRRQKKTLGATVTSYLYDGANAVQELIGATPSANMLTGLGVDEVFQRTEGATPRAFLSDALGGTLALADSAGVVQTSYTYSPYGETTFTGTASNNTSQYTGRENDNDGLYYYRARYYHPVFSRFVSEDPLGFAAGDANVYAYARSSPVNYSDPSGEVVPIVIGVALLALSMLDAHDLFLSGRKHSRGDYVSFVLGITPIGRAAKLASFAFRITKGTSELAKAAAAADRAFLTASRQAHILSRHAFGSTALDAGKFAAGVDIQGLIRTALKSDGALIGAGERGRFTFDYVADFIVGKDLQGRVTSTVRVVLDRGGSIFTAYPVVR